jgi:hypothetical protein
MNYSRRQLEAFGEPLGESVTRLKPGGRIYGGGGGGGPTTSTTYTSNILIGYVLKLSRCLVVQLRSCLILKKFRE